MNPGSHLVQSTSNSKTHRTRSCWKAGDGHHLDLENAEGGSYTVLMDGVTLSEAPETGVAFFTQEAIEAKGVTNPGPISLITTSTTAGATPTAGTTPGTTTILPNPGIPGGNVPCPQLPSGTSLHKVALNGGVACIGYADPGSSTIKGYVSFGYDKKTKEVLP